MYITRIDLLLAEDHRGVDTRQQYYKLQNNKRSVIQSLITKKNRNAINKYS